MIRLLSGIVLVLSLLLAGCEDGSSGGSYHKSCYWYYGHGHTYCYSRYHGSYYHGLYYDGSSVTKPKAAPKFYYSHRHGYHYYSRRYDRDYCYSSYHGYYYHGLKYEGHCSP